jgi:NhaP-type Na+/H+ or K+/H+ antiporter
VKNLELLIVVVSFIFLCFSLVSKKIERYGITPPMAFVFLGIISSPLYHKFPYNPNSIPFINLIAQFALVLLLFTDATQIEWRKLLVNRIPFRLLLIGLPLTIFLGWGLAILLFPQLSLIHTALLAILLAPTDIALGKEVISSRKIPNPIKKALHTESGLNDGLTLPFLITALTFANNPSKKFDLNHWFFMTLGEILIGVIVGSCIGIIGGQLIDRATKKQWIHPIHERLTAIGLSLLAYGLAQLIHGNGFISTFCAGVTLGIQTEGVKSRIIDFGEVEGEQLSLFVFWIFGALMLPHIWHHWTWTSFIYALCSISIVRIVPVALSMIGSKEKWQTVVFLGWFGPRGIASILFGLVLLNLKVIDAQDSILSITLLTVLLSVFLHGATARIGAHWYAKTLKLS